jgi:hypothetical protein
MAYHRQPSGSDVVTHDLTRGWRRERLIFLSLGAGAVLFAVFVEALATFVG